MLSDLTPCTAGQYMYSTSGNFGAAAKNQFFCPINIQLQFFTLPAASAKACNIECKNDEKGILF